MNNNWKAFVHTLVELGVKNNSREIARVITQNGHPVTWQMVAGVIGKARKGHN